MKAADDALVAVEGALHIFKERRVEAVAAEAAAQAELAELRELAQGRAATPALPEAPIAPYLLEARSLLMSLNASSKRGRMHGSVALFACNLAPLQARRDIALLRVIHRSVLGKGPPHFAAFFKRTDDATHHGRHSLQLQEYQDGDAIDFMYPNSNPAQYISRSMLGLTTVYNMLPADIVEGS